MARRFGCKVGLSDHSIGNIAACAAVAFGAKIIEKHFIVDHTIGCPDAAFSMSKDEFNCKFARSLFACTDIKKGELFTEQNVRSV